MIVLKGRVLDGNGGAPIEKGAVVLEDDRIRLVCRQSELPDDPTAEVYELEDGTIMPGLIDAHVHMGWGSATAVDWISMTPQLSMARALRDMAQLRQQGYTAFRDLGSDVLLMRPAVAEGLLDVPRIFGAGRIISQIGGHGDVYQKLSLEASQRAYSPAFIVNGVDEVRRACRINARNGADLIKIMTTGGVFSQGDKATPHSHFSQEEIRAAVEEAENMGSYVSTHAQATRGIKMALKNGVKCIEHGFYLDEECIELMVKNDCYLVPTLAIMHASKLYFQGKEGVLPYLKEKTERSYEAHYRSLEMARKAHITVGVGCDFLGDAAFGLPVQRGHAGAGAAVCGGVYAHGGHHHGHQGQRTAAADGGSAGNAGNRQAGGCAAGRGKAGRGHPGPAPQRPCQAGGSGRTDREKRHAAHGQGVKYKQKKGT